MFATIIPEPKRGSTRRRALSLINNALKELNNHETIGKSFIDRFWSVHCELANRGYPLHRCLSRRIIEAEWNMEYNTKEQTMKELRDLRNDLVAINKRRKEKLALCKP